MISKLENQFNTALHETDEQKKIAELCRIQEALIKKCKKQKKKLAPITHSNITVGAFKMGLNKMFAMAMSNIPENETDNYTAKELTPAFLGISELLENIK
ncbi:hypothetical protein [Flavobacterium sp. 14A]|uniref:hypothetical protein n=1 Tax=Flavobacterium sp. 14A TaxID=2735896 RepID=UPI00156F9E68|nr:hypothetical protein [Flavobacterium sp. 14A]NRT11541.1 hypothetical protein [Flavobacterium sp. 14A]